MLFMNARALSPPDRAGCLEVGLAPSAVVIDAGMAKPTAITDLKDDIRVYVFDRTAGQPVPGCSITGADLT